MSLVGSFVDITGATPSGIIKEAMEDESLPQRARTWPTWKYPWATPPSTSCLWPRQGALSALDLQPHLSLATYRLPFGRSGSRLFGEGILELLGLEEDLMSKKHTRALSQAMIRQFSSPRGGALPKQPVSGPT